MSEAGDDEVVISDCESEASTVAPCVREDLERLAWMMANAPRVFGAMLAVAMEASDSDVNPWALLGSDLADLH